MTSSVTSSLTFGQQESLAKALARCGVRVPSDSSKIADWLIDSQQLLPAARYVSQLLNAIGPNPPEKGSINQRTVVFCAFNSFDPITMARTDALAKFLDAFTDDPGLLTDKNKLRSLVREMNRVHERSLERAHASLTDSLERFNDNMSLGRPVVQCLENLFQELEQHRVFCCFARADRVGEIARESWNNGRKFVEAARDGKTYSDELVYPVVDTLVTKLQEMYRSEADYWYHEDMIRMYTRDTLIPHAVLNRYIEPTQTTDIFGALWRFLGDFQTNGSLLVCPPLLFHQSQQAGPRYIGVAEVASEVASRTISPQAIPYLEYRLGVKLAERQKENYSRARLPYEFSFTRLTRPLEFIPFLLNQLEDPLPRYAPTVESWLPTTFWAIDPALGIAGKQLRTVLAKLVDPVINQTLRRPTADQSQALLATFQEGFEQTMENAVSILRDPIAHFDGNYETAIDPYELREALVNVTLLGLYQPRSDWVEEKTIAERFEGALAAVSRFEIEPDAPINKLQAVEQVEKLIESLEPFYLRVMQLSFDPLAVELWVVLNFYTVATINSVRVSRLLSNDIVEDLLLPLNLSAFQEGLSGKAQDILIDLCGRIDVAVKEDLAR
jgi:hypothetical protein